MPITKATASSIAPAAKGDLVVGSATNDASVLAVGSANQVLTVDSSTSTGLKWAAPAAGGKVLQVVNAIYSTATGNGTNVFADTGLTATITPSSASNKILVIVNQTGLRKAATATHSLFLRLLRGGTTIVTEFAGQAGYNNAAQVNFVAGTGISYLDEPATTSAVTYKTQFKNEVNESSVTVQINDSSSTMTLLEIQG